MQRGKRRRVMTTPWKSRRLWSLLLLVLLAIVFELVRPELLERKAVTAPAQWIWAPGEAEQVEPRAFWAVRDFFLELPLAGARLLVQVDPEYHLYLDRQWLGSGRYELGAGLDLWLLEEGLEAGAHRIVVEARSASGGGGLLVALFGGEDPGRSAPFVVSDSSWRIFETAQEGILQGWSSLEQGLEPRSWGESPRGRWRMTTLSPQKPPTRLVGERWSSSMTSREVAVAGKSQSLSGTTIDFGEPISGLLELWIPVAVARPLEVRIALAQEELDEVDPTTLSIRLAGARRWRDTVVRRFRYVWLEGATPIAARVAKAAGAFGAEQGSSDPADPPAIRGPFGITAPSAR